MVVGMGSMGLVRGLAVPQALALANSVEAKGSRIHLEGESRRGQSCSWCYALRLKGLAVQQARSIQGHG